MGGGVLLATQSPVYLEHFPQYETSHGEDLWAGFKVDGHSFYVCVVYIPPRSNDDTFIEWFNSVESFCEKHPNAKLLILGDLNLYSASAYISNLYSCFLPLCNLLDYNCVNNVNGRMLDVVLASSEMVSALSVRSAKPEEELVNVDVHHPPLVVRAQYDFTTKATRADPSNVESSRDWNFPRADFYSLYCLIVNCDWSGIYACNTVDDVVSKLNDTLYNIFDHCIPKKIRKPTCSRSYPVYYTKAIIRNISFKACLHRVWKRTKNDNVHKQFKALRSSIKDNIKAAYNNYVHNVSSNLATRPSLFWQFVSTLRCRGGIEPAITYGDSEYRGAEAAAAFAKHFESVFLPDLPTLDPQRAASMGSALDGGQLVDIQSISGDAVRRAVKRLKANTSVGPDGIPAFVIKGCIDGLIAPIVFIFNFILTTGEYPTIWKLSRVTPIPKKGSKLRIENYRPIAILSALAKVFEMVMHEYLLPQCRPYITSSQHAFLPKRSVTTNLVEMVDVISREMDARHQVDAVYLDFQKAFDRVDNDVLLKKLSRMGFVPRLLKLFADYLKDRKQFVRYGPYQSKPYHTRSGISQGSNLGPFLFLIFINDLPTAVSKATVLLFADDVKLVMPIKSVQDCYALQQDIVAVSKWSVDNKLLFNNDKCEIMTFSRSSLPLRYDYRLASQVIVRVGEVCDLGVTFVPSLAFRTHARNVTKCAYQRLGFVLRNAAPLTTSATKALYTALVRSVLESNAVVWAPHENKYILMLEQVQKKFLRYLFKKIFYYYPYLYPTCFLQGHLGYESLELRRNMASLRFIINLLRNDIDSVSLVEKILKFRVPDDYCNRRRGVPLLAIEPSRTELHRHSTIPRTTALLNSMLAASPQCDVFVTGVERLMTEWKSVLERCMNELV